MSITLNAKGTSVPSFTIGKGGVTIYQGLSDPSQSHSLKDGDYWLDKSLNSLKVWTIVGNTWQAPRLADLHFVNSTIVAASGSDLTLSIAANKALIIDSGSSSPATIATTNIKDLVIKTDGINAKVTFAVDVGPGIITESASKNLYIDPTVGGGSNLILVANQWPSADGLANQVLTTNGSGVLTFKTVDRVGLPYPATTSTTGFANIPVTNGTPASVPVAVSGYCPMVADSGGNKLWVYINGSWKSTTLV